MQLSGSNNVLKVQEQLEFFVVIVTKVGPPHSTSCFTIKLRLYRKSDKEITCTVIVGLLLAFGM